jgi:glutamyl-Q tRNA(Asp) synthetase
MVYTGRFAPSPTGPLHAGSLVAALASWLDARAHGGRWLVRIEDIDTPRCRPGADRLILNQLQACGLLPDEPPSWQSQRTSHYHRALEQLQRQGDVFACDCSRSRIANHWRLLGRHKERHTEWPYPGTCRHRRDVDPTRPHAWRLRGGSADQPLEIAWIDRRLGPQTQRIDEVVGDTVLRRADGLWAYQLAVVVDDAAQGITDVVRGEDLADQTARQIHLQRRLGLPTPRYLHTPLVRAADGEKLSKQHGAAAYDDRAPLAALREAAVVLGLAVDAVDLGTWLAAAVRSWRDGPLGPGTQSR